MSSVQEVIAETLLMEYGYPMASGTSHVSMPLDEARQPYMRVADAIIDDLRDAGWSITEGIT